MDPGSSPIDIQIKIIIENYKIVETDQVPTEPDLRCYEQIKSGTTVVGKDVTIDCVTVNSDDETNNVPMIKKSKPIRKENVTTAQNCIRNEKTEARKFNEIKWRVFDLLWKQNHENVREGIQNVRTKTETDAKKAYNEIIYAAGKSRIPLDIATKYAEEMSLKIKMCGSSEELRNNDYLNQRFEELGIEKACEKLNMEYKPRTVEDIWRNVNGRFPEITYNMSEKEVFAKYMNYPPCISPKERRFKELNE
jgi:hypothetical protein